MYGLTGYTRLDVDITLPCGCRLRQITLDRDDLTLVVRPTITDRLNDIARLFEIRVNQHNRVGCGFDTEVDMSCSG
jgi:hypothetical protein